eukprot:Amastigsp_a6516_14.p5 type:complete len:110 gc:universal Amastigsp_a6516_14:489-160(-)
MRLVRALDDRNLLALKGREAPRGRPLLALEPCRKRHDRGNDVFALLTEEAHPRANGPRLGVLGRSLGLGNLGLEPRHLAPEVLVHFADHTGVHRSVRAEAALELCAFGP